MGRLESLYEQVPVDQFGEWELDAGLFFGAYVLGKSKSIREFSRDLLNKIEYRSDLTRNGETQVIRRHKAASNILINVLAMKLLDSCIHHKLAPPQELHDLLSRQLEIGSRRSKDSRQLNAKNNAAGIFADNSQSGIGEVARAVGVHPSTVSRWQRDPEFRELVERFRFLTQFLAKRSAR